MENKIILQNIIIIIENYNNRIILDPILNWHLMYAAKKYICNG